MIRLLALFPATDRDVLPAIRRAAVGLRGTPGLDGLSIARRSEPVGANPIYGPAVELSFRDQATLSATLAGDAWRSLIGAGKGDGEGVHLHAYEVEPLNAGALGLAPTSTDLHVAGEESDQSEDQDPVPVSTQLRFPSARPPDDDGDQAA